MIIKCVSRTSDVSQLIRYVLNTEKVVDKNYDKANIDWFIAGIHLTELDKRHLDAEVGLALERKEIKDKYQGDVQKYIDAQIQETKERFERKANVLQPTIIKHNLRTRSVQGYVKEFAANEKLRVHIRKDSVQAYHTILSFSALDRKHMTEKMLKDMAQRYISLRGPNSLFVGAVHQDKEHVHIHLVQSGTQLYTGIANRISKQQFEDIKRTMQEYQKDKYPELIHSLPEHGKGRNGKLIGIHAEKNIKTHERISPDKYMLAAMINEALAQSSSHDRFINQLPKGVEVYYRNGRLQGVLYDNRKYRFSSLGFKEQIKQLNVIKEKQDKDKDFLRQLRGDTRSRIAAFDKKVDQHNSSQEEVGMDEIVAQESFHLPFDPSADIDTSVSEDKLDEQTIENEDMSHEDTSSDVDQLSDIEQMNDRNRDDEDLER